MKRMLVGATIILFCLLSLAIVGLWICRRHAALVIQLNTPGTETAFICGRDAFHFQRLHLDYMTHGYMLATGMTVPPAAPGWKANAFVPDTEYGDLYPIRHASSRWVPMSLAHGAPSRWFRESPPFADGSQLSIRYWFCLIVTLGVPVAWLYRRYRHRTRDLRRRGFPMESNPAPEIS